jgi:YjbE family integral membrane protein
MQLDITSWFAVADGKGGDYAVRVLQIIWIDVVLSGDNALVIALACRSLPPAKRLMGVVLGAGVAILLRVAFTVVVQSLLGVPWLKVVGGLLLLWIAIKLLTDRSHEEGAEEVAPATSLIKAVQIIAVADVVMSLDNVLAIAAAARDDWRLVVFGLLVSIPIIIFGATLIGALLARFPILVWAGAALLGWIAGELFATDIALAAYANSFAATLGLGHHTLGLICAATGAVVVLAIGWALRRRRPSSVSATGRQ